MRFKETQDPKPTFRYKLKHKGINIDNLNSNIIAFLNETVTDENEIVITSANDGVHADNSRHYTDNAVDIRFNQSFYNKIKEHPARIKYGVTLIDPNHGTAPHIDLSFGKGSQSDKDVWMNVHSQKAQDFLRQQEEITRNTYIPDKMTVKPLPVTQVTETLSDVQPQVDDVPINTPQIPPSIKAEQQLTELMGMLSTYETTKITKVNEKAKKSKATQALLQKQKEANFKRKLQEQQFLAQLLQASQIPTINVDRVA